MTADGRPDGQTGGRAERVSRRDALQIFAGIPLLAAGLTPRDVARAAVAVRSLSIAQPPNRPIAFVPAFFTPHEWETVRVLVDLIIPKDARSGSATEALVPEFMDFILNENSGMQTPIRGGLAWLDDESRERFGQTFSGATDRQRRQSGLLVLTESAVRRADLAHQNAQRPAVRHDVVEDDHQEVLLRRLA